MTAEQIIDEQVEGNIIEHLKQDDIFKDFLNPVFDPEEYANKIIESQLIGQSLGKLADGISLINKEILTQVSDHHEDLLSQATGIETLEGVLHTIQSRIQSLGKAVDRVRSQVTDPYNRIASRTRQLRRLQTTCEYLRRIIRVLYLSKRLQLQLKGGNREITKAAQSLHELDYVTENIDLSGIQIVEQDLIAIKEARVEVEKQAKQMLHTGLNTQNQGMIGTALQVFYNLNMLTTQVNETIDKETSTLVKLIRTCLDTSSNREVGSQMVGPGRVSMPTPGNTTSWRKQLWENMEKLMSQLVELCQKILTLEKVLSKKRDTVSHTTFIEMFSQDGCSRIFKEFWHTICSTLRSEFDKATHNSTHLQQAFEGEFPKLLHIFNEFWIQISSLVEGTSGTKNQSMQNYNQVDIKIGFHSEDSNEPLNEMKASCQPYENQYLSRSLSRLFDSVNLVFPDDSPTVPANDDLQSILKTITSELHVASVDKHLLVHVCKNVLKTIQLYTTKCEEMLITSTDSGQLTGQRTSAQIQNASIVNSIYILYTGITEVLPSLVYPPPEALDVLEKALNAIDMFMDIALSLMLSSIMASLENKISKIHSENFSISMKNYHETIESQPCSRYIKDIQEFLARMQSDYLTLYMCGDFTVKRLEMVGSRLLELFVRHASLIRDISEGGSLKLAADMAQLEFAVTNLCRRFEDLGKPYKLFRAFRPLLFQTLDDIPTNPNLGDGLPYSTVLHFLFSKAPPQLTSPHTVAGWTVPQYSEWLDDHQEEAERITLIRGTLEAYVQKIRKEDKSTEPIPVYKIMMQLIEKSL